MAKANEDNLKPGKPTVFDYGVNWNTFHHRIDRPASSGVSFDTLRRFSIYYPIVRSCINHLKAQVRKLDWDVVTINPDDNEKASNPRAEELKKFFRKPGKNKKFTEFVSEIIEDLEVLDAVALYKNKTLGGEVLSYTPVDGATIRLQITEDGATPEPPEIAYQQIIRGQIQAEMTTDEMIYAKMHSRTNSPYGLGPLESLVTTVSTALKVGSYNLAFLTEGNVPEGFITLPEDVANDVDQVKEWQGYFDALIAGNPTYQTKLKVIPSGTEYTPTKKADDMSFERFEKWLLQNTCAVFGVPPQAIGFTYEVNKATGETQKDIGDEKGTLLVAGFLKELFDQMIQEDFGQEDLEFAWTNIDPVNEQEEVNIQDQQVRTGILSIDEVRIAQGLNPIGMNHAFFGASGPVLLDNYEKRLEEEQARNDAMAADIAGATQEKPDKEETKPNTEDKIEESREIEELKKWRKVELKRQENRLEKLTKGEQPKEFIPQYINPAVEQRIKTLLEYAVTKEDIERAFKNSLDDYGSIYRYAIKLNAELNSVAEQSN